MPDHLAQASPGGTCPRAELLSIDNKIVTIEALEKKYQDDHAVRQERGQGAQHGGAQGQGHHLGEGKQLRHHHQPHPPEGQLQGEGEKAVTLACT